jgi:hypothetical protein
MATLWVDVPPPEASSPGAVLALQRLLGPVAAAAVDSSAVDQLLAGPGSALNRLH